jgi:hypothetical protein
MTSPTPTAHLGDHYTHVLHRVATVTGIPVRPMLYCNRTECVDARALLVNLLLRDNLTESEISALTTLSTQCVNKLKNTFRYRLSRWSVRHHWQALTSEV